jgi:hypothetical protein
MVRYRTAPAAIGKKLGLYGYDTSAIGYGVDGLVAEHVSAVGDGASGRLANRLSVL